MAVLVIHMFIFQPFIVPTPSMAGTVLPGDYIIVSKLHYGPRTPRTLSIPYTDLYLETIQIPSVRFPGFSTIQHGDVAVFHYPPDDKPIDKRQPYLKRVIGLPGDQVEVRDKVVYINGQAQERFDGLQQYWRVYKTDPRVNLPVQKLEELGIHEISDLPDPSQVRIIASDRAASLLASWSYIDRVEPFVSTDTSIYRRYLFPPGRGQTPDNYGPVWTPRAGDTIELTAQNWPVYASAIARHEGRVIERTPDGAFLIDGVPAGTYTFVQNYYFMIGDNRDNSLDSRFWGFVPEDHIMGKAIATFFSWDKDAGRPRLDRIFRPIQ
jgi:signal peptidase I